MATRTWRTVSDERPVVVDARALATGHGARGIGRVTGELIAALAAERVDVEVRGPAWLADRFPRLRVRPVATRVVNGVLSPGPFLPGERVVRLAPVAPGRADRSSLTCCHDLMPLKSSAEHFPLHARIRRPWARTAYQHSLETHRRAAAVWVPTMSVATDVRALLGIASSKVRVIPLAAPEALVPPAGRACDEVRRKYDLPREFLLWVPGGVNANKNVEGMLRAHARGGLPPLVVVGRFSSRVRARLSVVAARWGAPSPRFVDYVGDDDLAALNVAASCVVVPSLDEGFGLPLVEACALGARVAASDIPVLREVAGPAVVFGDARDDACGFHGAILRALASPRPEPYRARTWRDVARDVHALALTLPSGPPTDDEAD